MCSQLVQRGSKYLWMTAIICIKALLTIGGKTSVHFGNLGCYVIYTLRYVNGETVSKHL